MNEIERKLFEKLAVDREDSARVHDKPSEKGFWNSVDEKYTDRGHFVYELIQNADDAEAQYAKFILNNEELVFIHNGKKHFNITNVDTEEEDTKQKRLGHINSITSIGNSTKTNASIGKFGVGFKAVFQYTDTPHIYDDCFQFKLRKHIIPEILNNDYINRKKGETIFVLPFNHQKTTKVKAFNDIKMRLESLIYPTLFLNNLKSVEFEIKDIRSEYTKEIIDSIELNETLAEKVKLVKKINNKTEKEIYWMFSRKDDNNRSYYIGYKINNDNILIPVDKFAFCYFSTMEKTNLNFIINAPFLLTDNRQGILAGNEYNKNLIELLAKMSADSIEYLKDIGEIEGKRIVNDNILDIIPIDNEKYSDVDNVEQISFLPFYENIKRKFLEREIIPTKQGYVSSENAYWASVPQICEIFTETQLKELLENDKANWVFCGIGRNETKRNNEKLSNYIDGLVKGTLDEDDLLDGTIFKRNRNVTIKGINEDFIRNQNIDWLFNFYKWMSESAGRKNKAKKLPIFLDEKNNPVAIFDNDDKPITFLPNKKIKDCQYINEKLLNNADTFEFLKELGIKEPSLRDYIYNVIIPLYKNVGEIDNEVHFDLFFQYYLKCTIEEVDSFVEEIKELEFINYFSNNEQYRGKAEEIYMPTIKLKKYFEVEKNTNFLDYNGYLNKYNKYKYKLDEFFEKIGIQSKIRIYEEEIKKREDIVSHYSTSKNKYIDKIIDGCKANLINIIETKDKDKSFLLWNFLLEISTEKNNFFGVEKYSYYGNHISNFDSTNLLMLKSSKWIVNNKNEFVAPYEICKEELSKEYDVEHVNFKKLVELLEFKINFDIYDEEIVRKNKELESQGKDYRVLNCPDKYLSQVESLINKLKNAEKEEQEINSKTIKELFKEELENPSIYDTEEMGDVEIESIQNIDKRTENIKKEIKSSSGKKRKRNIKTTSSMESGNEDEKQFLEMQYKGECQICGEKIVRKDNKPYFFCTDLIPKSHLMSKDNKNENLAWDALCLCPNCSARHKLGLISFEEGFYDNIKNYDIPEKINEYIEFNIKIKEKDAKIKYTPKHLHHLKVYLNENESSLNEEKEK